MSYIGERVSYLNGLMEGLGINDSTNEGKMLVKIVEVLQDMAEAVDDIDDIVTDIDERVDEIDADLADLEDYIYDDECDECDCDCDDCEGCGCGCEEDDFLEIKCPHCGEISYFDTASLEDDVISCPACGKAILETPSAE